MADEMCQCPKCGRLHKSLGAGKPPSSISGDYKMALHDSTFEYLKPTDAQIAAMAELRAAAKTYADALDRLLPDGPDKTFVLRAHRSNAMWVNVAVTRQPDGTPRS